MKKEYLVNTYNAIFAMQQIKGTVFEFRRFVNHFKKHIKNNGENVFDDLELWQEDNQNLALEYALKDDQGNVMYDEIGAGAKSPRGLLPGENNEYDIAKKEHKAKKDEILDGEIEIDPFEERIHKKHLPKSEDFTAAMQEFFEDNIDG